MKVVVIGGSLSGLMHGLMFKHNGCDVHIIEQTPRNLEAQAAGISAGAQTKTFLDRHDRSTSSPISRPLSLPSKGIRMVDSNDQVKYEMRTTNFMTSWDALYFRLRANFDGLVSEFCPHLPDPEPDKEGKGSYETGKKMVSIDGGNSDKGQITVQYKDMLSGKISTITADIVIGADGANSTVRSLVYPSAPQRRYAGYVLWRGIVPETELSAETLQQCNGWFSFFEYPKINEIIVTYTMPGQSGSVKEGSRGMNFAWYTRMDHDKLSEALTDIEGHQHRWAVPIGKLDNKVWERQLRNTNRLSSCCGEIATKVKQPFVQVISDCSSSQATFCNKRVLLVGEALVTLRPHTGISVAQIAASALLLEDVLFSGGEGGTKGGIDLWEQKTLDSLRLEGLKSISWGEYWLGGWSGWLPAAFSYHGLVQFRRWKSYFSDSWRKTLKRIGLR